MPPSNMPRRRLRLRSWLPGEQAPLSTLLQHLTTLNRTQQLFPLLLIQLGRLGAHNVKA